MAKVSTISLAALEPHTLGDPHDGGWTENVPWNRRLGVRFLCPQCWLKNSRSDIGVHSVICWSPAVPQTVPPIPGRWNLVGTSLADLTLVAGSSSVALTSGCRAHFFIRAGQIEFCGAVDEGAATVRPFATMPDPIDPPPLPIDKPKRKLAEAPPPPLTVSSVMKFGLSKAWPWGCHELTLSDGTKLRVDNRTLEEAPWGTPELPTG